MNDDPKFFKGHCAECGYQVTTTSAATVPHVCARTLHKHTLTVARIN